MTPQDLDRIEPFFNASVRELRETPFTAFLIGVGLATEFPEFGKDLISGILSEQEATVEEWKETTKHVVDGMKEYLKISTVGGN